MYMLSTHVDFKHVTYKFKQFIKHVASFAYFWNLKGDYNVTKPLSWAFVVMVGSPHDRDQKLTHHFVISLA